MRLIYYLFQSLFIIVFFSDTIIAQTVTESHVTLQLVIPGRPNIFCSSSPESITVTTQSSLFKSLDINFSNDCAQTDYTLGDCSGIQWEGPDILSQIKEDDPTSLTTDGKYPFCRTYITVRPKQSAVYKIRFVTETKRNATSCFPASIHRTYYEGEINVTIYPTPPTPTLTAQTQDFPSPGFGEALLLSVPEQPNTYVEWSHMPGNISGNQVWIVNPYECKEYQARYRNAEGPYICFSDYSNSVNSAKEYKPQKSPGYSGVYANYLNNQVEKSRDKPEYFYRKQYSCLQRRSAEAYRSNPNGWAGGFPKYLFDKMAVQRPCEKSMEKECESGTSNDDCLYDIGFKDHVLKELEPNFYQYPAKTNQDIDKWIADHESFLTNAVEPCFAELKNDPAYPSGTAAWNAGYDWVRLQATELSTKYFARQIRSNAIQMKHSMMFWEDANRLYNSLNDQGIDPSPYIKPTFPAPPAKEEIFIPEIEAKSAKIITINNGQFFIKPNENYQIQVKPKSGTNSLQNPVQDISYWLSVDPSIATINQNGVLTIHKMAFPVVSDRFPILVFVKEGDNYSAGQFAIFDTDVDGDQLNDSYERSIGLDPMVSNAGLSDLDGDNLLDQYEALLQTNPLVSDTDADGYSDSYEVKNGSDPRDPNSIPTPIFSLKTGVWSSPSTWSCDCIPSTTDIVQIKFGHTITYDVVKSSILGLKLEGSLRYNPNTTLEFLTL